MSSVWLTIPSARPDAGTAGLWKAGGYKIAIWRDQEDAASERFSADGLVLVGPYPGYARAVNALVKQVLERDPEAEYCIATGDDTEPDRNYPPAEIARQCTEHFKGTFGVMQPTGDRWADGSIDRVCGSPWIGREFCRRMYGGKGPYFEEYRHMFLDNEIQEVALKLGVLWQRRDLTHLHKHFCRVGDGVDHDHGRAIMPEFLREANSPEHWTKYSRMFEERRAAGFPGHEPIAA